MFLFLYLASKPSILYYEQSNRERTRERAAKLFPAPRTRVVFCVLLSSDFLRLPQVESLLAGYRLQVFEENWKGEIKALENEVPPFPLLLPSYFMFPRAIWYPTWQCCITLEPSTLCSNSLFFMRSFLARSQNCKHPENPAMFWWWCPFQSHVSVKWNISFEQYTG